MKKLKEDYGGLGGNYPQHDYHRDSRDAFGGRYYHPRPARNRSGWVLVVIAIAALTYLVKRFILGQ